MARSVANLAVSVTANTRGFARGMSRARKQTKQFTLDVKGMTGVLRQMGAAALLNPITAIGAGIAATGAAFVKAARSSEEFNRAMRNSQAIMGDLTSLLDEDMRRAALDVAKVTTYSAQEAARAYFFLASAGLTATQSIKALPIVAQFAQAGMFDLARATDLLTDAQSALGLTVDDAARNMQNMQRVGDVLVKANTLANASVEQFSESLTNKAGAALKIVGKDIEEGVAVLAAFADQGLKGSDAGTALNIVMRDMQTKALQNKSAFAALNVAVFDTFGEMRNMAEIVGDIERALAGMSDATKKQTLLTLGFSDKSVIFLQTLIGLSDRIREYERELRSAGSTMAQVADKQLTPFQKGWEGLKGAIMDVTTGLQGTTDAAGKALGGLAKWIDRYRQAFSDVALGGLSGQLERSKEMEAWLARVLENRRKEAAAHKQVAVDTANEQAAAATGMEDIEEILARLQQRLKDVKALGPLWDLRELGASAEVLAEARDLMSRAAALEDVAALDDLIRGLERESQVIGKSARELDVLEAGWIGATAAQLAYINNLHDAIDASREQAKLERQAKVDAARQAKMTDRVTRFVEVDLSRTIVSGLTMARNKKQKVRDDDAVLLLERIERNTQSPGVAIVAAG